MIVIPNVGSLELLAVLRGELSIWIHLYRADVALELDTLLVELVELDVPGYAPQLALAWSDPEIVARRAQISADPLLFTRGAGDPQRDVYGYFATSGEDGPLLWVERAANPPIPMRVSTDLLYVVPRYSLRGERRRLSAGL